MARTTQEIYEAILAEKANEPELSELTNTSQTSRWRLIAYIVAKVHNVLELIFDKHKQSVMQIVSNERWGTLGWYVSKALVYQHGQDLIAETDTYDNSGLSVAEIEQKKVVKYAAVHENTNGSISLKVAKGTDGNLESLSVSETSGLRSYFNRIRPAGIVVNVLSADADLLKKNVKIQYNPLILDSSGKRIDGTSDTPVLDAINKYLAGIEFAGEYSNMALGNAIESIDGCVIVDVNAAYYKFSDFDYALIESRHRPYSGYMKLNIDESNINYEPYD